MSRRKPDWVSELSVTDEPDDQPGRGAETTGHAEPGYEPTSPDEPAAEGLAVRWCALLAVLALALAVAGGTLLDARRNRTVTNTVVGYRQPHGIGLTGCPRGDVCQPLPQSDAELAELRPPELAGATLLASSVLIDSATSATVRSVQLLAANGLTLTLTGQCVAGAEAVRARETEPARSADGSLELALVRPGRQPGCSVALVARIPAGQPLPGQLLRRIADELPARLIAD